ncbi:hypothetical protein PAI11_03350 [Patulibacter medicamentivorans]|uniref:Uncharacterized protein n=1 Tax=Patulibacter medicamentivorans TaxID=1097667 RepID=H0E0M7_9ACTN|nr:hypothetical protein PAI11_03350 [Patulibacter medicamentivorans]
MPEPILVLGATGLRHRRRRRPRPLPEVAWTPFADWARAVADAAR